jgi:hypothetical protein
MNGFFYISLISGMDQATCSLSLKDFLQLESPEKHLLEIFQSLQASVERKEANEIQNPSEG